MTKSLEQLIKEYGNACYANDNDDLVIELEREIMNRIKPLSNEKIELLRVKTLLESEEPLRLDFHKEFARVIETAHGITS